jgi:SWI/SNF-related matrix-associated actin-dependent regulator 1 of chromatin subfamily A
MAVELIKQGQTYICKCTFAEKDIPKNAGFRWNPDKKHWYTNYQDTAIKLYQYSTDELKQELESIYQEKQTKINNSKCASLNINLPSPQGLDYRPFQKAGINTMLERQNILLADEMGLGKTIQAIGLINCDPSIQKVLVICTASLKINWKNELNIWLINKDYQISIWNGKNEEITKEKFVIIINYDVIKNHFDLLKSINFDLLIIDECHYLKNSQAQRTKLILGYWDTKTKSEIKGIAHNCKRKIYLTGTPIPNRPIEIFPLLHSLDPQTFSNPVSFGKRYCAGYEGEYGWNLDGSSHLDELQLKLRETVMIRRLKKDVLTELPNKTRQVKLIPSENSKSNKKILNLLGISDININNLTMEELKEIMEVVSTRFEEISALRHEMGQEIISYGIDEIEEYFENGIEKLIVFVHHLDVIQTIEDHFGSITVKITGDMKTEDRQKSVDQFQNNPNIKLIICSIKAAGVGLTLTAANHILFVESDWTPGNNQQAEDRAHRIGQKNNVNIKYLAFNNSLHARILQVFLEKEEIIKEALDQEIKIPIIEKTDDKNIIDLKNDEFQIKNNEPSTKINQISNLPDLPDLPKETKEAIKIAVCMLASVCNYAQSEDNRGFNKLDTTFGHNLADRIQKYGELSYKQYLAAKRMIQKYKRQIPSDLYQIIYK